MEGLEREPLQSIMEQAMIFSSLGGAIVEVHAVHKHEDVSDEYDRDHPREPWLRRGSAKMRRWRGRPGPATTFLDVRRFRPPPHFGSVGGCVRRRCTRRRIAVVEKVSLF